MPRDTCDTCRDAGGARVPGPGHHGRHRGAQRARVRLQRTEEREQHRLGDHGQGRGQEEEQEQVQVPLPRPGQALALRHLPRHSCIQIHVLFHLETLQQCQLSEYLQQEPEQKIQVSVTREKCQVKEHKEHQQK